MGKETCLECVLHVQRAQGCPVHPASEVVFALFLPEKDAETQRGQPTCPEALWVPTQFCWTLLVAPALYF